MFIIIFQECTNDTYDCCLTDPTYSVMYMKYIKGGTLLLLAPDVALVVGVRLFWGSHKAFCCILAPLTGNGRQDASCPQGLSS